MAAHCACLLSVSFKVRQYSNIGISNANITTDMQSAVCQTPITMSNYKTWYHYIGIFSDSDVSVCAIDLTDETDRKKLFQIF